MNSARRLAALAKALAFTLLLLLGCSRCPAQCRDFLSIGDADGAVTCMVAFDEDGPGPSPPQLLVGGSFDHINGVAARGVARWDGTSWSALGDGLVDVRTLAVYNDGSGPAIYAGGGFSTPSRLAKWDGYAWVGLSSSLTGTGVNALTVYDEGFGAALFAAGSISAAGGAPTDNVAAWNGSSWRTFFAGPSARLFPSVAYDSTHNFLVMFGGRQNNGSTTFNETWTWNGSSWTQATQAPGTAPSARVSAPMCFDSLRGRMIMLGGSGDSRTWAFNGTTWTMIVPTSLLSGQRTGFRIAYDAARDRVVLFGGKATFNSNLLFNDTWEFNGSAWAQVSPPHAPSIRRDYAMTYDSTRHRIVLFGGVDTAGYLPDTWEYDGTDWTQVSGLGPAGTEFATMTFDTVRSRAVMFGVITGQPNLQTWAWDGTEWTLLNAGIPSYSFRNGAPIAYDIAHDRVVQRDPTGVQWSWDNSIWSTVGGGGPGGQINCLLAHDDSSGLALYAGGTFSNSGGDSSSPDISRLTGAGWGPVGQGFNSTVGSMVSYNGSLYVSGGFTYAGAVQVDGLARWNGAAWSAVNAPGGTRALRGAGPLATVTDESGPVIFASGPSSSMRSILRWNASGWSPITSSTPQPTAREYAAMAYDSARSRCVLFGGTTDGTPAGRCADTYEWDGRAWYRTAVTGPSARWGHVMAFDSVRARTLLVGGGTPFSVADSETWSWDGSAWTLLAPAFGTTTRSQSAAAYDSARDRLVLFGGRNASGAPQSDTWEWDGSTWTQRSVTGPDARYAHAMAYDPDRHRIVMTGGIDSLDHQFYDTWEFDGSQWTLANNNPDNFTGPISDHSMVYDSTRQRTVICGGRRGSFESGTVWEWDGQAWTSRGSCEAWGRAAAYDSRLQTLVAFGGLWGTQTIETTDLLTYSGSSQTLGTLGGALTFDDGSGPTVFVFGSLLGNPPSRIAKWSVACAAPTTTTHPQSQTAVFGQTVVFTGAVSSGTTPITYQWRRNGIPLHNINNYIIGATTPALTIDGWSLNDAGQYDLVASNPTGTTTSNPATLTVTGSVPGSPVTVTRIVYPPDPIPGSPGSTFANVADPQLSPTNEVLFLGRAANSSLMLCLWDSGTTQVLYRAFDPIPGAAPGEILQVSSSPVFPFYGVMGCRRLWFTTDLGGPNITVANRRGLWYQDDTDTILVARQGMVPAGYSSGTVFSRYGNIYPSGDAAGDLIFTSWVDDLSGNRTGGAAWAWSQSGGHTVMARYGDTPPGSTGTIGFLDDRSAIFADGTVAIGGQLSSNRTAVWTGTPSTLSPLVLSTDPPPGLPAGSTFNGVGLAPSLTSNGRLLLGGTATIPPGTNTAVMYRTTPSGLQLVAAGHTPAPGAPEGDTFNSLGGWAMNDQGDVLFYASMTTLSCLPPACPNAGLWLADAAGGMHPIMFNYSTPPAGTPAIYTRADPVAPGAVNNSGIVIFDVLLSGPLQSTYGVYGWTPTDGTFPISIPGTQMEVRPGVFKTVSQSLLTARDPGLGTAASSNLTHSGALVMTVAFTDASTGLFMGQFGDFFVGRFPCRVFVSPSVQTVAQGGTTTFAASASGSNPAYRWQLNGVDLADGPRISGTSASVLTITSAVPSDAGSYTCTVTNACGTTVGPTATLTVTTRCGSADFNCDGDVGTDADIEAFFACLAGNCPPPPCPSSADFNGDGDAGTDADIESFFRVLAGGSC